MSELRTAGVAVLIAGVDEAGRGPLAGPVVAAAVILDPQRKIKGLRDSKLLTPESRDRARRRSSARAPWRGRWRRAMSVKSMR